jgi:isoleucyl-tRNA synthetase
MARFRDERLEGAMATARRAVELGRTLRASAGIRMRQPVARMWLALPGTTLVEQDELLGLIADELNVKAVELIGDESELVDRRVKVLLPKVGKRLGPAIPAVMAAARDGTAVIGPDGSVEAAGQRLARDEVEIQAAPRPGTAVAHDEGLVVVIDTELTPELRAEGDARELQRGIQDLRKEAGLDLDAPIELWVSGLPAAVAAHLPAVAKATLAEIRRDGEVPRESDVVRASVDLDAGRVEIALRSATAATAA